LRAIVDDISENIGTQEKFDAAIIVIKITDYRLTMNEIMALNAIKNFFENFEPSQVFCIVTHVDMGMPDPEVIEAKRKSFEKYGKFEVKKENMILFDNTAESLQPLVDKLTPGNMNFAADLDEKCK
jgi:hypothetical protein